VCIVQEASEKWIAFVVQQIFALSVDDHVRGVYEIKTFRDKMISE
jgi:hypothetical protein